MKRAAGRKTPTMSRWCSPSPAALCSARRGRADDCGAPFAPASPEGPAKRRGQTPAQQPEGRGATRSRPSPASMASGVDRIAAPRGTKRASIQPFFRCLFRGAKSTKGALVHMITLLRRSSDDDGRFRARAWSFSVAVMDVCRLGDGRSPSR